MSMTMTDESLGRIAECLGEGFFSTDPWICSCYSDDFTEQEPCRPAAVAVPDNLSELQRIVQVAHDQSTPLVPRCAGTNVGGLCIPAEGSVVVDLSRLDRIVGINEKDMVAVIEPGVTWAGLSQTLLEADPPLTFAYPLAPLHSSVLAGCLLDGLGSLSLRHGTMSEMTGGMEVLLPDGSFIRTGMAALFKDRPELWLTRAPLPDLSGLFVGWQGTTGIVTKLSIQVWRLPVFRERFFVLFERLEDGFDLITALSSRFGLCDDLAGITWPASRFLFRVYEAVGRIEPEPEFFAYVDIGGMSREEIDWKKRELDRIIADLKGRGTGCISSVNIRNLVRLAPSLGVFARQPTTLSFLISHSYGGMTWVGVYGPLSNFARAARECMAVMEKQGVAPSIVSRPMKGGHFGVLRFLSIFDKSSASGRAMIRRMNEEIVDVLLSHGFAPYKPPPWAWPKILGRMDPGTADFIRRIRSVLDDRGIMNPGKLPM